MEIATQIIIWVLSIFFIFASSIKILGWQKKIFEIQLAFFEKYGLNRIIMRLVGILELVGAILIWFLPSTLGVIGACLIAVTSIGAIFFHIRFDKWTDGIPAFTTLNLSGYLIIEQTNIINLVLAS